MGSSSGVSLATRCESLAMAHLSQNEPLAVASAHCVLLKDSRATRHWHPLQCRIAEAPKPVVVKQSLHCLFAAARWTRCVPPKSALSSPTRHVAQSLRIALILALPPLRPGSSASAPAISGSCPRSDPSASSGLPSRPSDPGGRAFSGSPVVVKQSLYFFFAVARLPRCVPLKWAFSFSTLHVAQSLRMVSLTDGLPVRARLPPHIPRLPYFLAYSSTRGSVARI